MSLTTGRLAPSPTGLLHLGHARSFLVAWWYARSRGGRVLLRMEDLDRSRVKPGMHEGVLRDLEWLGLDWDGPVLVQSEDTSAIEEALEQLCEKDLVYPCVCTRTEIRAALSAPHTGEESSVYPGTCRDRFSSADEAREATGREPAMRFRTPPGVVHFDDALHGSCSFTPAAEVGDFPVTSRDGQFAYQLAVVADDARQGVTEVVRGDDLLPSTAQQLLLQRALGLPHPTWIHVPLVVDAEGRRLAKRTDDLSLAHLREIGVDPGALVAWLAHRSGIPSPGPATPAELTPAFALERLPAAPLRLDPEALASLLEGA